jgi:hypothetical protein
VQLALVVTAANFDFESSAHSAMINYPRAVEKGRGCIMHDHVRGTLL